MSVFSDRPRWSGYATQSIPWQRGYEWAYDRGPHAELGCTEALEEWGYGFDEPEAAEFERGVEFAQGEIQE